ncbi:histidinol-phosphate transaminase [Zavarzinia compransoris]|uniref:histidinol-phosphate transaminase n=1 Tax=Zavarzinia marina TaxID=2911065 RepID=UPI001F48A970|nr:histidinol-phosphate transaminase [Zavarzinia marina]MCF4167311.1 histidinol-phosphate transaminase [Zavarzinia marina]
MAASTPLIRDEVTSLPTYNAGLHPEKLRRQLGLERIVKLDSNENPLGPSPAAIEAVRAAANDLFRYPDRDETVLRGLIAARLGVDADRLAFGDGSEDLIGIIYRMVMRPGECAVTTMPSFGLHKIWADVLGAHARLLPFEAGWRFPVAAIEAALAEKPRVLILATPSNPVGAVLTGQDIGRILAACGPETLLILDEAYVEFVSPEARVDTLAMLAAHHGPWVVLRTFSKAYGLAGLRIGYGIAHDADFVRNLYKVRSPFSVNAAALAAAEAAYADTAHLDRVTAEIRALRAALRGALALRGYAVAPSEANSLFFDTGRDGAAVAEALRRRGVLVKPWLEPGYTGFIRVSIGTRADNEAFLAALDAVMAEA